MRWLDQAIADDERRLEELETMALSATNYDKMPSGSGDGYGKTERLGIEIAALKDIIASKRRQRISERVILERWIEDIDDQQTRLIFKYRFVDGMSWSQVADAIDGGNTDATVKMTCYRYLDKRIDYD